MIIKEFSDKVLLPTKKDVLRVHLYFKLVQHDIKPFENDIDMILDLYEQGGYTNAEEQSRFIEHCITKKYRKSDQSVRNFFSKYNNLGVFIQPKNLNLSIDERFLPKVECDKILLKHIISHAE